MRLRRGWSRKGDETGRNSFAQKLQEDNMSTIATSCTECGTTTKLEVPDWIGENSSVLAQCRACQNKLMDAWEVSRHLLSPEVIPDDAVYPNDRSKEIIMIVSPGARSAFEQGGETAVKYAQRNMRGDTGTRFNDEFKLNDPDAYQWEIEADKATIRNQSGTLLGEYLTKTGERLFVFGSNYDDVVNIEVMLAAEY